MKISGDSNLHKSENQALHSSIYGQTKQQQAFTTRDHTHMEFQAHQFKTVIFRQETYACLICTLRSDLKGTLYTLPRFVQGAHLIFF